MLRKHKSPLERLNNFKTDSPVTTVAKLFLTCNILYFVNDEVRAECPKLVHPTLSNFKLSAIEETHQKHLENVSVVMFVFGMGNVG